MGASRARFGEAKNRTSGKVKDVMENLNSKVRQSQRAPPKTVPRSFIDLEFPPCEESINKTIVKSLLVLNNGQ